MRGNSRATHCGPIMVKNDRVSKTRKERLKRFGHYYYPFKPPGHWREASCVYCGNTSQTKDHIPPLAWMEALGPSYFTSRGLLVVWIPACKECNSALRDRKLFSIKERTGYLIDYYMKKYDKFATTPVWTQEQINELRGRLKKAIEHFAVYQIGIDRRLKILEENYTVRSMPEEFYG